MSVTESQLPSRRWADIPYHGNVAFISKAIFLRAARIVDYVAAPANNPPQRALVYKPSVTEDRRIGKLVMAVYVENLFRFITYCSAPRSRSGLPKIFPQTVAKPLFSNCEASRPLDHSKPTNGLPSAFRRGLYRKRLRLGLKFRFLQQPKQKRSTA
jgi:hypothetical protein